MYYVTQEMTMDQVKITKETTVDLKRATQTTTMDQIEITKVIHVVFYLIQRIVC